MRLERLNYNKIKIFLTLDDLSERGLTKEDLWQNSLKVHHLFREMIDEASEQLGFEASGSLAVEVFAHRAQGMIVIVTRDQDEDLLDEEEEDFSEEYIEMQVTLEESDYIMFEFATFEDVILACERLYYINIQQGELYSWENKFYLSFDHDSIEYGEYSAPILAEYGSLTTITKYRLAEYGKKITSNAVETIVQHFCK